jgi:hypothetical protein
MVVFSSGMDANSFSLWVKTKKEQITHENSIKVEESFARE